MLDTLDLNLQIDRSTYQSQIEDLMRQLRLLQNACWEKQLPLIVVLEGWAAAGKGALVKTTVNYMDPRGFTVHPILAPSDNELRYPFLWRFWHKLPHRGSIAFFYHSWYVSLLEDRLFDSLSPDRIPMVTREINAFERQLIDDGMAIAKFWIHLSRKELKHRLKKRANDDLDAWRVRPQDWQQAKRYSEYAALAEEILVYTSTGAAPWTLVEGNCERWARVKVLSGLVATIREALDRRTINLASIAPSLPPQQHLLPAEPDFLAKVDLSLILDEQEYKQRLRQAQIELVKLQLKIHQKQLPVLILFEGWDAAGKGGAIKRLTDSLDPRSYKLNTFGAPTEEEHQYHYLWRFWRRIPGKGTIGIFDRSWYGRVLVERVEGFCTETEWRRAYREINEFEASLTNAGYALVKFWLHISPEEQLKRFEARSQDLFKEYKLTEEDWRNRDKWNLYEVAINQAIGRTTTPNAPWTIVPANDKYYARVFVIETAIAAIKAGLEEGKSKK
jgi:polyphosphate:AMP phosphotransferase